MGAACGWCVGFGFRSLVVSSSVRDPRCWFLVCWCCFGCVGSACPACVALCCSALPCVRFVCSGRDELIVHVHVHVHNGFVNKTIGTTQRVASDTTQERSANEKNQTDRIRHHKRCRRSGGVATAPPRRNPHGGGEIIGLRRGERPRGEEGGTPDVRAVHGSCTHTHTQLYPR